MFWKKKDTKPKPAEKAASRESIIAQARANMATARAEIGEDTLEQIRVALMKKQQSAIEQAKNQIKAANIDKVRDNIQFMMREEK